VLYQVNASMNQEMLNVISFICHKRLGIAIANL
jgi:hypothetical protein